MTDSAPSLPRILIVDDSRIVRATIIKGIRGRFEVREEADGEAGWEALLVDPAIRLVISDLSMPRLDGYGLVARMRAAKVARIREMPVIMISGDEDEASRQRARDLGATDFIAKGTGTAELSARLEALLNLARTQEDLEAARAEAATDSASGLMSRPVLLRQVEQTLAYAHRHGSPASVLVLGFDRLAELAAAHGARAAEALLVQFARLLAGVVRKEDSIARWSEGELAIATPGLDPEQTRAFAERLRAAVARALIRQQESSWQVTATIGVAHIPSDGVVDAAGLFALAERRMIRGREEGGNRVVVANEPQPAAAAAGIDELLACLAGGAAISSERLAQAGLRLLPLLRRLEKEFQLALPLTDLESRLATATRDAADQHNQVRSGVR